MATTLTLTLEPDQLAALKRGISMRADECRGMVAGLTNTGNGSTQLADFWRLQLAAATAVQQMLREVA